MGHTQPLRSSKYVPKGIPNGAPWSLWELCIIWPNNCVFNEDNSICPGDFIDRYLRTIYTPKNVFICWNRAPSPWPSVDVTYAPMRSTSLRKLCSSDARLPSSKHIKQNITEHNRTLTSPQTLL